MSRGGGCAADNIRHPLWPSFLLSRSRERRTQRCVRGGSARNPRHRNPPRRTSAHAASLQHLVAGNEQHHPAAGGFRACGRDQRAFRSPFGNLRCAHFTKGFPAQETFGRSYRCEPLFKEVTPIHHETIMTPAVDNACISRRDPPQPLPRPAPAIHRKVLHRLWNLWISSTKCATQRQISLKMCINMQFEGPRSRNQIPFYGI